jgi:nuclear transport factor 2 (NTF2) superfamily protein
MVEKSKLESAVATMRAINRAWLEGQIDKLAPVLHPDIIMVFPGFAGRIQGREEFLSGFRDFCQSAKIHEFREDDHHVDVAGETTVVTFRYEMVYERSGERFRSTGRDLWVFEGQTNSWIAVWCTMLDMEENPA